MKELLTTAEAAKALKVDNLTIYRLTRQGDLPVCEVGRMFGYKHEDIEALIEARRDAKRATLI